MKLWHIYLSIYLSICTTWFYLYISIGQATGYHSIKMRKYVLMVIHRITLDLSKVKRVDGTVDFNSKYISFLPLSFFLFFSSLIPFFTCVFSFLFTNFCFFFLLHFPFLTNYSHTISFFLSFFLSCLFERLERNLIERSTCVFNSLTSLSQHKSKASRQLWEKMFMNILASWEALNLPRLWQ